MIFQQLLFLTFLYLRGLVVPPANRVTEAPSYHIICLFYVVPFSFEMLSRTSPQTSREKLIDHYLGHNAEDPALEGTCSG